MVVIGAGVVYCSAIYRISHWIVEVAVTLDGGFTGLPESKSGFRWVPCPKFPTKLKSNVTLGSRIKFNSNDREAKPSSVI